MILESHFQESNDNDLDVRHLNLPEQDNSDRAVNLQEAEAIMESDFLGPEAIKATFDIELTKDQIPSIPFSKKEMERAQELNQFLILRVNKTNDGKPLTMKAMEQLTKDKVQDKILFDTSWYKNEDFFTKETPQLQWALVSKEPIPNSTSKQYVEQTEEIINYIQTTHKDIPIPQKLLESINEFNQQKEELRTLQTSNWPEASKRLESLQITQLTRQTLVEVIYDLLLYKTTNNTNLLPNIYTWTARRDSDGDLVCVGYFGAKGVNVSRSRPDYSHDFLGVSFSCSVGQDLTKLQKSGFQQRISPMPLKRNF